MKVFVTNLMQGAILLDIGISLFSYVVCLCNVHVDHYIHVSNV